MAQEFNPDIFDSMVNGSFEEEEEISVEEEEDITEDDEILDDDTEDSEDNEDTDLEDDDEDEDETDDLDDGEDDEDDDVELDDEEEDTLVEDDDLDDEAGDAEDEDLDDDETLDEDEDSDEIEAAAEDEAETEEAGDGELQETDTVDYKKFYDEVVNTEFTVNGKKSKGFADPKKIIQSMQMAGGFSEKMAGFKKYRPFMAPLKDRGMFDDQSKFDLAMNIIDGDKEAIKQHLQTLEIDPLELDMETIRYERKASTASDASLAVEDAVERAKNGGYEERFRNVIGNEWDTESFDEFVSNPNVRNDLLEHMESGAYDKVTDKMAELSRLDFNGAYGNMSTIAKYRAAVQQLQAEVPEAAATPAESTPTTPAKVVPTKAKVRNEKVAIKKARDEAAYKQELKVKEDKMAKQRKRAASMSKKKPKSKPAAKFDPMKVEGEELDGLMDFLINGGN